MQVTLNKEIELAMLQEMKPHNQQEILPVQGLMIQA